MSNLYANWGPILDLYLLHLGFAFAQYLVLRAGVFSLATAALGAIGAYAAGILAVRYAVNPAVGIFVAIGLGMVTALVLSWPLARLRGVYQAIATLAFVQIVLSLNIYAEGLTGGAMGLMNIPKVVGTFELAVAAVCVTYLVWALNTTRLGRTFDAIRENEAVAVSLGVSVVRYQALAFALSGGIAGLFGALEAFHSYALDPNMFGFPFLIAALSYVVFGGRKSVLGPIVGTAVLILLPELARPLAENRILVYGLLLILVINFMPKGIADTALDALRRRRLARRGGAAAVRAAAGGGAA
jgi:branched-chain amino acid transport system permease protein